MKFLIIPGISFFLAIVFVYFSNKFAHRFRIYDYPNSELTIHERPVPLIGGIGIFMAVITTLIISFFFIINPVKFIGAFGIFIGGASTFSLGLWDDLKWKGIRGKITYNMKFILQLAICLVIALVLFTGGCYINIIPVGIFGILLTIFYISGSMNAVNMQDGVDGLAAGLVAISSIGFAVLSILSRNNLGLLLSLSVFGATVGFLIFNFHPASIFMGDNGSHFLGFMLAVLAIIFTSRPYDLSWFIGPILVIGLPVADCAWAMVRRIHIRKNICQGDRGHIYDKMIQKGVSTRGTVFICYLIQVFFVVGGVSLTQL